MELRLLGPLEVWHGNIRIRVTAPMQRALLAGLALRLGTAVPTATIIDDLWGDAPPRTGLATVRNYVRRLRTTLPAGVLQSTSVGYQLAVEPHQVDVFRFRDLLATARERGSVELFDEALSLWRGDPLTDVGQVPLRTTHTPRLEDAYLEGVEAAVDLRLRRGHDDEVLTTLLDLTHKHPLRERLAGQLILALYRNGRAPEALAHYRRLRSMMVDEIGMEPGPELRHLETAILREDVGLLTRNLARRGGPLGPARAPADLPTPPTPFVGRADEVEELSTRFSAAGRSPVHCSIYGQGGCGKSALAARIGSEVAPLFPDGALYVDLGGSTPGSPIRSAAQVVAGLVRALGGTTPSPALDIAPLVGEYRSRLRGRRILVFLDNAATAAQVRPALPDEPGCAAIVTSRRALTGNGGVFHLGPLGEAEAVELLGRIAGMAKVRTEPAAARSLTELCGRLPLALRSVGARAALRPHWPLGTWTQLLADERTRLDMLRHEDVDVRASIMVSLDELRTGEAHTDRDAAALLPLLGHVDAPHVTAAAAAALADWPVRRAERALEALLDVQLLYSPAPARYACYDLVRLLAKELAGESFPGIRPGTA